MLGSPDPALDLRTFYADDLQTARMLLLTEDVDIAILWIRVADDLSLIDEIADQHADVTIVAVLGRGARKTASDAVRRGAHALLLRPLPKQAVWAEARAAATRHRAMAARYRLGGTPADDGPAPSSADETILALARANERLLGALVYASEINEATVPGHAERVSRYACLAATRLGFDEGALRDLDVAARLHDVGKIGVRAALQHRGGPLAVDEREEMRGHVVMGAEILSAARFSGRVVQWVLHHHERFDGRGYPLGLAGTDIPVGARLLAVADAAEVMTTGRAYRDALDWDECLAALRAGRGTQFDAAVVDAFAAALSETHGVAASA